MPRTNTCRWTSVVTAFAAAAWLSGCHMQRPPNQILSDAQHAATYGQYDKAAKDYEELLVRRPEDAQARYELGQVYMSLGRPADAKPQFKIASDVQPLNDEYFEGLASALAETGEREQLLGMLARRAQERGRVEDYLRFGSFAAKVGAADEALFAYQNAARLARGNYGVHRELAGFFASIGDRNNQIRHLRMAYTINPGDPALLSEIRGLGEVPGPTFRLPPE